MARSLAACQQLTTMMSPYIGRDSIMYNVCCMLFRYLLSMTAPTQRQDDCRSSIQLDIPSTFQGSTLAAAALLLCMLCITLSLVGPCHPVLARHTWSQGLRRSA